MANQRVTDIIKETLRGKKAAPEPIVEDVKVEDEVVEDDDVAEIVADDDETNNRLTKEETDVSEETMSASSLHPAAKAIADPKALTASKIAMMQGMMGQMNSMSKGDLTDWFTKTMAQFGHWSDKAPNDSSKNANSLDMKPSNAVSTKGPKSGDPMPRLSVKEDVEDLFAGEELSEEFKEKTATLFEAAVSTRVIAESARLEEEYETALNEELNTIMEGLAADVDTHINYIADKWLEENKIAIESALRNEILEEFIDGLKGLFTDHYIDVPKEKRDVVEEMGAKVAELEDRVVSLIEENEVLKKTNLDGTLSEIFEDVASDLAVSQKEKLEKMAEGIEFDGDITIFRRKLEIIKENYFSKNDKPSSTNLTEETFEGDEPAVKKASEYPDVARYVDAISRTVKK